MIAVAATRAQKPAATSTLNSDATHCEVYKAYQYRLLLNGICVAGMSKVTGLTASATVPAHSKSADPDAVLKGVTRNKYDSITLERGVTSDPSFSQWASGGSKGGGSRRDLWLEVFNEAGRKVGSYKIAGCRVSEFQAQPDLDAAANSISIVHLKLDTLDWLLVGGL